MDKTYFVGYQLVDDYQLCRISIEMIAHATVNLQCHPLLPNYQNNSATHLPLGALGDVLAPTHSSFMSIDMSISGLADGGSSGKIIANEVRLGSHI